MEKSKMIKKSKHFFEKYVIAIIIGIMMLISIVGCGKNNDSSTYTDFAANKTYDISKFPFKNEDATKYAKLCTEAMRILFGTDEGDVYPVEKVNPLGKAAYYKQIIDSNEKKSEDISYYYYGEFKKGRADSDGVIMEVKDDTVQCIYAGDFSDGRLDGFGMEITLVGKLSDYLGLTPSTATISYVGNYKKGKKSGDGVVYYAGGGNNSADNEEDSEQPVPFDGEKLNVSSIGVCYVGKFKKDQYSGKGQLYETSDLENVYLRYEGNFKKSRLNGKGIEYFEDGEICYKGKFKNGKYNGKGVLYNENGSVKYKGKFKSGKIK